MSLVSNLFSSEKLVDELFYVWLLCQQRSKADHKRDIGIFIKNTRRTKTIHNSQLQSDSCPFIVRDAALIFPRVNCFVLICIYGGLFQQKLYYNVDHILMDAVLDADQLSVVFYNTTVTVDIDS